MSSRGPPMGARATLGTSRRKQRRERPGGRRGGGGEWRHSWDARVRGRVTVFRLTTSTVGKRRLKRAPAPRLHEGARAKGPKVYTTGIIGAVMRDLAGLPYIHIPVCKTARESPADCYTSARYAIDRPPVSRSLHLMPRCCYPLPSYERSYEAAGGIVLRTVRFVSPFAALHSRGDKPRVGGGEQNPGPSRDRRARSLLIQPGVQREIGCDGWGF